METFIMLLQVTDFLEYFVAFVAPELPYLVVQRVRAFTAFRTVSLLLDRPDAVDVLREDAVQPVLGHRRVA